MSFEINQTIFDMDGKVVALKVDVDTFAGTRDGVPHLIEDMEKYGIKSTFYFSLGPDNSGKAIRRIFTRKGFLKKMLRTKAPSAYGIKTMLYGTILPAPMIGSSFPQIIRETEKNAHEIGIHCWDHVKWHDYLPWFPKHLTAMELGKAAALFQEITGKRAETTAAPGWTVSPDSLEVQDAMQLSYCSDSRGEFPFYPVMNGRKFRTLQIPTTVPTADELIGTNGITADNIDDYYLANLQNRLNVITIHAELEGGAIRGTFQRMLKKMVDSGVKFITLSEAASRLSRIKSSILEMGEIDGRAGNVAIQKEVVEC